MLDALKQFIGNIDSFLGKFERDEDLTQFEIDLCRSVVSDCHDLAQTITDELPRNLYFRNFRKTEDGKFVRDDAGEYIGVRGMGGQLWFRHKDAAPPKGKKYIGPKIG